jgi:hypothetical protein
MAMMFNEAMGSKARKWAAKSRPRWDAWKKAKAEIERASVGDRIQVELGGKMTPATVMAKPEIDGNINDPNDDLYKRYNHPTHHIVLVDGGIGLYDWFAGRLSGRTSTKDMQRIRNMRVEMRVKDIRALINEVLLEADPRDPELAAIPTTVKIRSVAHGATPSDRKTTYWIGDRDNINVGLIMADVPKETRIAVLRGEKSVPSSVISMLKKRGAIDREKLPKPVHDPNIPKAPRQMTSRAAEEKLAAAIRRFAKNWTNFTTEMPDIQPEDAASDAALSFFYEYPEWEKWVHAMWDPYGYDKKLSKSEVQERVADYVFDAMMKGKERAEKVRPKAPPKQSYKIYGKKGDATAHTRLKGKAYVAGKDTQFKPGESASVSPEDGKLRVKKPGTDHSQLWDPE